MSLARPRTKRCVHDKNRSVVLSRDSYILATHIQKLLSASPLFNWLRPYQKHDENQWNVKKFKLLTYPLSYSSLQEDAVTEENSTHIKHSLQKRDKETIDWGANKICYSKFTWRGLQRHWDVFNQFEEIFQLRFQLHFQRLDGGTDICSITIVGIGTWS